MFNREVQVLVSGREFVARHHYRSPQFLLRWEAVWTVYTLYERYHTLCGQKMGEAYGDRFTGQQRSTLFARRVEGTKKEARSLLISFRVLFASPFLHQTTLVTSSNYHTQREYSQSTLWTYFTVTCLLLFLLKKTTVNAVTVWYGKNFLS